MSYVKKYPQLVCSICGFNLIQHSNWIMSPHHGPFCPFKTCSCRVLQNFLGSLKTKRLKKLFKGLQKDENLSAEQKITDHCGSKGPTGKSVGSALWLRSVTDVPEGPGEVLTRWICLSRFDMQDSVSASNTYRSHVAPILVKTSAFPIKISHKLSNCETLHLSWNGLICQRNVHIDAQSPFRQSRVSYSQ